MKKSDLLQAELALNEANKLDPEFGDVWGNLALINGRLRHPALFRNCLAQARKYGADPALIERLEKLEPFVL